MEAGYLGNTFDRPFEDLLPWFGDGAELTADLWTSSGKTRAKSWILTEGYWHTPTPRWNSGAGHRWARPMVGQLQRVSLAEDPGLRDRREKPAC